ncbi:hypothetical protein C8R41DRAFT_929859 [Lentinula lateritia]|uniref:Uncharacterized protein n=1 Tax=Lentinula lateritia TaxID=40482 RepID=A0ABQ8VTA7_9AGAR|nr:hypothetical protein C8R41DRAFT_929859 [Lentinula lateritia]
MSEFDLLTLLSGFCKILQLSPATSIIIFLAFYIRRRRRRARIEHDTAVSATLAAAGFTRRALDDDLDDGPGSTATGRYRDSDGDPFGTNRSTNHSAGSGGVLEMGQRSSSHLSGRNSAYSANAANPGNGFNPYTEFGYAVPMGPPTSPPGHPPSSYVPPGAGSGPGYIPVANGERGSPVPGHSPGPSIGGNAALGEKGHGHNASAGSYEPLLGTWWASQGQTQSENPTKDEPPVAAAENNQRGSHESGAPPPPPRNPRRLIDSPADPGTPSPLPPAAGHRNKPSEDLLGLGALSSGGTWGAQKKTNSSGVKDDSSSVYSNDDDNHLDVGKTLLSRAKSRAQGSSKARREGTEDASLFGDHEDYSQRVGGGGVLGVRNVTDLDRERSVRSSMDS